ncbi:HTH-type transcriptional repressor PurR [Streptomyces violaceorubidus]
MASIKDVAAEAGVSVATVSRALNGHPSVSAAARARVLAAVETLGYRPNAVARSLRTDQTRTLGLVISDVMNPYFTELARSVEEEARALGYSVIIGNADERPDLQDHHVTTLLDRRIDGLLVSPTDGGSPRMLDAARAGTPMVFVDRWIPGVDVPVVRSDGRAAVRDLVAHLHGLGTGGSRSSPARRHHAGRERVAPSARRSPRTGSPRTPTRPGRLPGRSGRGSRAPRPARQPPRPVVLRRRQPFAMALGAWTPYARAGCGSLHHPSPGGDRRPRRPGHRHPGRPECRAGARLHARGRTGPAHGRSVDRAAVPARAHRRR